MKRLRGESSYENPQFDPVENDRKYLQSVKEALEEEKYEEFLGLLEGFENKRIGVGEMKRDLTNLFQARNKLIVGFNKFLPEGCKMKKYNTIIQAVYSFRNMIHERFFKDDNGTYNSFVDILEGYRREKISADKVYVEVDKLFEGHLDLISRFNSFKPETFCGLDDFVTIVLAYARNISPLDPLLP